VQFDTQTTKRSLRLIFFIMLMDVVGMSIIFSVAPCIVQNYSNDALIVTMLTVIYAGAQFLVAHALWMLFPLAFLQSGITDFIWATTGTMAANLVRENEQGQLAGVNRPLAKVI